MMDSINAYTVIWNDLTDYNERQRPIKWVKEAMESGTFNTLLHPGLFGVRALAKE